MSVDAMHVLEVVRKRTVRQFEEMEHRRAIASRATLPELALVALQRRELIAEELSALDQALDALRRAP